MIRSSYLQKIVDICTMQSKRGPADPSLLDKSKAEQISSGQTSEGQLVKAPKQRDGPDAEMQACQNADVEMQAAQYAGNGGQRAEWESAKPKSHASSSSNVESLAKWREPGLWSGRGESIEAELDLRALPSPRHAHVPRPMSNSSSAYEEITVSQLCATTPLSVATFHSESKQRWSFQEAHSGSQHVCGLDHAVQDHMLVARGKTCSAIVMDWSELNFGQATDAEKAVLCEDFFARQVCLD